MIKHTNKCVILFGVGVKIGQFREGYKQNIDKIYGIFQSQCDPQQLGREMGERLSVQFVRGMF